MHQEAPGGDDAVLKKEIVDMHHCVGGTRHLGQHCGKAARRVLYDVTKIEAWQRPSKFETEQLITQKNLSFPQNNLSFSQQNLSFRQRTLSFPQQNLSFPQQKLSFRQ
jgi:hypothetical protein